MNFLIEADKNLLIWLNAKHAQWLDGFMFAATGTVFWMPFYFLLIYLFFKHLDNKAWLVLGCIGLTILVSDQLTSSLLKPLTERLRPSHEPSLDGIIHLFQTESGKFYKGGKFGFPSSHASNAFGVAVFTWLILRNQIGWIGLLTFPLALIISYTRIYLGVHYPSDIIFGAALGAALGFLCWKFIFRKTEHYFKTQAEGKQ
ncbi:MAG: phosphatase PAP2 family protein [Bacteroidetes bacterium]|nr:phosphatase PAP2 family protein [Bacteroidota bacterium]